MKRFLSSRIDGRLQILPDDATGKLFIASDFNRIKQSYRSPWSNVYIPQSSEIENYYFPPEQLRKLEMTFNELLLSYCHVYYENAIGSAYFSEGVDHGTFFVVIHIKKDYSEGSESHCWESTHSVKVSAKFEGDQVHVEIAMTSTVLTIFEFATYTNLNGSVSKTGNRTFSAYSNDFDEPLVRNLGELLEENENGLRGTMENVSIPRCTELAMASFGTRDEDEENLTDLSSDSEFENVQADYRSRMSFGAMNPLHRKSVRPVPAFQADLIGAINQRMKEKELRDSE